MKIDLLIVLVVLCGAATLVDATCPQLPDELDIFSISQLPYSCASEFGVCSSDLCECSVGGTFSTAGGCEPALGPLADAEQCAAVDKCLAKYVECVGNAYMTVPTTANATCTDDTDRAVLEYATELFLNAVQSADMSFVAEVCKASMCGVQNTTQCDDSSEVICDVFTGAQGFCKYHQPVEYPFYSLNELPVQCSPDFAICAQDFAACNHQTCADAEACIAAYITCVNTEYIAVDGKNAANCTLAEHFSEAVRDAEVGMGDAANQTLFNACVDFLCETQLNKQCPDIDRAAVCPSPVTNGSTPAPSTAAPPIIPPPYSAPPVVGAVRIVIITLTFAGNFDSLMETRQKQLELKNTLSTALTNRLRAPTKVSRFVYTSSAGVVTTGSRRRRALAEPSLTVTANAEVAAGDSAKLNELTSNIESMKTDTNTGWLSSVATLCGCVVPAPTVSFVIGGVANPTENQPPTCGKGCVAGAVVGSVAVLSAGVGGVAYASFRKTGPSSNEPTEVASPSKQPDALTA
jgi:hypothetical protein